MLLSNHESAARSHGSKPWLRAIFFNYPVPPEHDKFYGVQTNLQSLCAAQNSIGASSRRFFLELRELLFKQVASNNPIRRTSLAARVQFPAEDLLSLTFSISTARN
jgi:hypothetical protein